MDRKQIDDFSRHVSTLEEMAGAFQEGSPEAAALLTAVQALIFVQNIDTKAKFQQWVNNLTQPPTALQILYARLAGVDDIPHELLDETLCEIDQLMKRMNATR